MGTGTTNYMSPEQFDSDEPGGTGIGPKSDMWCLAATIVHMLTGKVPWQGLTMPAIYKKVHVQASAPPTPPSTPPQLAALLKACFVKDPMARPSAREALQMLQAAPLEGLPSLPASQQAACERLFATADADGSGNISGPEALAFFGKSG